MKKLLKTSTILNSKKIFLEEGNSPLFVANEMNDKEYKELFIKNDISYYRLVELLKRTIEVCGGKDENKYSNSYEDFIEILMERTGMTKEEYDMLFEEEE